MNPQDCRDLNSGGPFDMLTEVYVWASVPEGEGPQLTLIIDPPRDDLGTRHVILQECCIYNRR